LEQCRQPDGLRSAEIAGGKLKLVLNNTLAAVEDGRSEIMRFLGPLDAMAQNRLEVLFEELVSNTIRHGFAKGSGQSIHVQVERRPDAVTLVFEDDGLPFDPTQAELPGGFTSAETARVGGLGIPLIVKLSSALRYEALSSRNDAGRNDAGFHPRNRTTVSVAAQSAAAEEDA
jgi:anti-sigma regulatory factor (Ser/Thr protein kinase)